MLQCTEISTEKKKMERMKFECAFKQAQVAFLLYKKNIKDDFEKTHFQFEQRVIVPIEKSEFFMREILFKHLIDLSHTISLLKYC